MIHGIMAAGTGLTGITVTGTVPGTMTTGTVPATTAAGIGIPGTTIHGTMAAGTGPITIMATTAITMDGTTIITAPAAECVTLRPIQGPWPLAATGKEVSPRAAERPGAVLTAAVRQHVLQIWHAERRHQR